MKKITYSEYAQIEVGDRSYSELQEKGEAEFMEFGVDYEDLEHGVGIYSSAIIKLSDGTVKNIPCEHIKFITKE